MDVTVASGTATSGSDFVGFTRTVLFNDGETSRTIPIPIIDDTAVEGDETVILSLSANSAYTVGSPNSATITIADNLLAKAQEAGDATQMAGSVAMMLQDASGNTERAVAGAEKLLHQEQWMILPPEIRDRLDAANKAQASLRQ